MIYKSAAGMIVLTVLFFAAPVSAQIEEKVGGSFYGGCGPADNSYEKKMVLDNHLRITVFFVTEIKPGDVYRTKTEVAEGEKESMLVSKCDEQMKECKSVEGILTVHKADYEAVEATIEYFDGTEVQGDNESIQGHTTYFQVQREKTKPIIICD
jgi:hypothetical protein